MSSGVPVILPSNLSGLQEDMKIQPAFLAVFILIYLLLSTLKHFEVLRIN